MYICIQDNINLKNIKMRLDENFTLEGQKHNWILKFSKDTGVVSDQTGKNVIATDQWYFPKIEQALNRYKDEVLKVSESIEAVLEKLTEVTGVIESVRT